MRHIITWGKNHALLITSIVLISASLGVYLTTKGSGVTTAFSYTVIDTVDRGAVSSGIHTTGEVIAAQKLDLDVYKQLSRIDVVNAANGVHVTAGEVLVSFDKSDVYVDAESTRVTLAEAELSLDTEKDNATDPNTEIRTLENSIATYQKSLADLEADVVDAYKDFLNTDLEVEVHEDDETRLLGMARPTLSGRYVGTTEGVYVIDVYGSGSESGYSYRVSGLESHTDPVVFGRAVDLGTRGLKITFPQTTRSGDTWVVRVPNTDIATYAETKADYEKQVADIREEIATTKVTLANAVQNLEDLKNTDSASYRNLDIERAAASVDAARQQLSEKYDVIQERDVVAPFSGTIQDMENVVVGATPTGGTEDTINLGTLISDEFLATFTLSATDVAKVSLGQKVHVTITSYSEQPVFTAEITEISSLPASSGVAQYEVLAKIAYDSATSSVKLREGVLADIEIVEEEHENVVRVPVAAITYVEGKPTVQIVDALTDEQKKQIETLGIVRTAEGETVPSYVKTITLGIFGTYYAEVTGGLEGGEYILTTSTTETTKESVVEQAGFGPPRGERMNQEGGTPPGG